MRALNAQSPVVSSTISFRQHFCQAIGLLDISHPNDACVPPREPLVVDGVSDIGWEHDRALGVYARIEGVGLRRQSCTHHGTRTHKRR
jgi:hypothetical protein